MKIQILLALSFFLVAPAFAEQAPATTTLHQETAAQPNEIKDANEINEVNANDDVTSEEDTVCFDGETANQLFGLLGFTQNNSGFQPASAECRAGCWIAMESCLDSCWDGSTMNQACAAACGAARRACADQCSGCTSCCLPGTPGYPDCIIYI